MHQYIDNPLDEIEDKWEADRAKYAETSNLKYELIWGENGKIQSQIRADQAKAKYYNAMAEYYRLKTIKEFGKNYDNQPEIPIVSGKVL